MRRFAHLLLLAAFSVLRVTATTATAPAQPLDQSLALAALAREIAGHYSLEGELQLEALRPIPLTNASARHWSVRVLDFPAAPASNLVLRCQFIGDDQVRAETTLMVRASLWRDAWSTRQTMVVGAPFDPAQLATQRVDFLRERDAVPVSSTDFDSIFARGVPANRLVQQRDLTRRPLVRKGDLVEITATDGQLSVTLQALALENGAAGQVVSVRNVESRKTFHAIVTDEKRAQIRL